MSVMPCLRGLMNPLITLVLNFGGIWWHWAHKMHLRPHPQLQVADVPTEEYLKAGLFRICVSSLVQ